MSSYKPIDSKREEFRKYLEKTGVMDALTKALVALYEEVDKPEDALSYMRSYLGGGSSDETIKALQKEVEDLKIKLGIGVNEAGDKAGTDDGAKPDADTKKVDAEGDGPPGSRDSERGGKAKSESAQGDGGA